jgi:hypothetical protein
MGLLRFLVKDLPGMLGTIPSNSFDIASDLPDFLFCVALSI